MVDSISSIRSAARVSRLPRLPATASHSQASRQPFDVQPPTIAIRRHCCCCFLSTKSRSSRLLFTYVLAHSAQAQAEHIMYGYYLTRVQHSTQPAAIVGLPMLVVSFAQLAAAPLGPPPMHGTENVNHFPCSVTETPKRQK